MGGSEAGKRWTLKSGGLEPRSLTEVYAYGKVRYGLEDSMYKAKVRPMVSEAKASDHKNTRSSKSSCI